MSVRVKKWTPPPWKVDGRYIIADPKHVMPPAYNVVAYIGERRHEEDEANAELIASAPQLYDAVEQSAQDLEEAATIIAAYRPGVATRFRGFALILRELLAKARGEVGKSIGDLAKAVTDKVNPKPEKNDV